jgi:uncharacterized protein YcaQ
MSKPRKVSGAGARRFLRRVHLLDAPVPGVGEAIAHHGYIQIDPINICGRMHDHILRNRVCGYSEGGLMRHLHGGEGSERLAAEKRSAFEHHLPSKGILAALPLEAWPHLQAAMRARTRHPSSWSGRLTAREREFEKRVFEALAAGGPVGPEDFESDSTARRGGWGSATVAKSTLQKLYFHGRLLIAARQANRRLYDLPERVLPAAVLALRERTAEETARWAALTRMRQHRLVALKRSELALLEDLVQPVAIDGCPVLHCLCADLPLFDDDAGPGDEAAPMLLAPLDPMIYDRRVTRHVWGFDYTWEVYVPAPKRKRGYYALPVLAGRELVGHVDLKADREKRRLGVVSRKVVGRHRTAGAVGDLARFLGLGPG